MVEAVGPGHQVETQGGVPHRAGQGPHVHEPQQGLGPVAGQGDAAVGRLQPDNAAVVGRLPDGPAHIAADAQGRHTGGDSRGLSAAGAAGGAAGHPRVLGAPVDQVVGLPPQGELRHVGLGDKDSAGVLQPLHHGGVGRRDVVLEEPGTAGSANAGGVHAVFHGERHAVQRPPIVAPQDRGLRLPGPVHHPIGKSDQGVQRRVHGINAVEVSLRHLHRRHFPQPNALGQLGGIGVI